MIRLTKGVEFCAAHRYANPQWSDAENRRVFGKCVNVHGHNYVLEVTIQGEPSRYWSASCGACWTPPWAGDGCGGCAWRRRPTTPWISSGRGMTAAALPSP